MKRLFILASAAIVALAACTKTEVVYTEAPAEIGFKQITDVMTKAVPDGTQLPATMGVYAYKGSDAEACRNEPKWRIFCRGRSKVLSLFGLYDSTAWLCQQ